MVMKLIMEVLLLLHEGAELWGLVRGRVGAGSWPLRRGGAVL